MKLLLIEDEPAIQDNVTGYFGKKHYHCTVADNYAAGRHLLLYAQYDCILLDLALGGGGGLDLLTELRDQQRKEGVIIISARNSFDDKINALENGADDYLTKPFHLPELNARVRAVVRRKQFNGSKHLHFNELKVQIDDRQCFVHGIPVSLSRKETSLLLLLVANHRRIVSKIDIADHLAGNQAGYFDTYDIVYAHMKNLKRKLADAGCTDYIVTVHGMGYKFNCAADSRQQTFNHSYEKSSRRRRPRL
jgi:DNA-binding response OmpR family regulator